MKLWQKLWLLFAVIWVVVSALNAGTIIAFAPDEQEKALRPLILLVSVPAVTYLLLWVWFRFRRKDQRAP
jgi:hypothetical protein